MYISAHMYALDFRIGFLVILELWPHYYWWWFLELVHTFILQATTLKSAVELCCYQGQGGFDYDYDYDGTQIGKQLEVLPLLVKLFITNFWYFKLKIYSISKNECFRHEFQILNVIIHQWMIKEHSEQKVIKNWLLEKS